MFTLTATANDIELALKDLHTLAATGERNDARHTGELLLALYEGESYPLNLQDFANLCPTRMRQAMQLLTFLMITGTSLSKFISEEAMREVEDNLSILRCHGFMAASIEKTPGRNPLPPNGQRPKPPAPPPARDGFEWRKTS